MKRFFSLILALTASSMLLTACQRRPQIDIKMPTSPPNPQTLQPSYGPHDPAPDAARPTQ